MAKKNFILLLSLSKDSAAYGKALIERVTRDVDPTARPAWIDSRGVGLFIQSDLRSDQIWDAAIPREQPESVRHAFREMLILEIGPDCCYRPETIAHAWMTSHRLPRQSGSS